MHPPSRWGRAPKSAHIFRKDERGHDVVYPVHQVGPQAFGLISPLTSAYLSKAHRGNTRLLFLNGRDVRCARIPPLLRSNGHGKAPSLLIAPKPGHSLCLMFWGFESPGGLHRRMPAELIMCAAWGPLSARVPPCVLRSLKLASVPG